MTDHYATLGISRGASADDIKKAFRKLAHIHHPDKPGGNAEKFKKVKDAFDELSKNGTGSRTVYEGDPIRDFWKQQSPFTDPNFQQDVWQQAKRNQENYRKQAEDQLRRAHQELKKKTLVEMMQGIDDLKVEYRGGRTWYSF